MAGYFQRIKRAADHPRLFIRGFNRLVHRRFGLRSCNTNGIEVFERDWDTLIVLDACRYDMFEEINGIDGELSSEVSRGSATAEWLQANFPGRDLSDTVYVTANPQLEPNRSEWGINLHEVINVWLNEGWDEETGTVRAETMTEAAINAHERFPNKRIVVHYMQPHYPFVPSESRFDKAHLSSISKEGESASGENVWNQKFIGELGVSEEELWSMYVENLGYALDSVRRLVQAISGKPVITADHGNFVGERASPLPIREYGHPRGIYDEPLVSVPWFEAVYSSRRNIKEGEGHSQQDDIETDEIEQRLRDLGYRE